jgi:hypothetical protein
MSDVLFPKFKFNRSFYEWRRAGALWLLIRTDRVVAVVVPDAHFPSMFRIRLPDGSMSDMVNLTRAKDAALSLADAMLDGRIRPSHVPSGAQTAETPSGKVDLPDAPAASVGANPTNRRRGGRRA